MNIIQTKKPSGNLFSPDYKFVLTQGRMGSLGEIDGDYAVYHGAGTAEEVARYGTKLTAKGAMDIFPEIITEERLYRR